MSLVIRNNRLLIKEKIASKVLSTKEITDHFYMKNIVPSHFCTAFTYTFGIEDEDFHTLNVLCTHILRIS